MTGDRREERRRNGSCYKAEEDGIVSKRVDKVGILTNGLTNEEEVIIPSGKNGLQNWGSQMVQSPGSRTRWRNKTVWPEVRPHQEVTYKWIANTEGPVNMIGVDQGMEMGIQ